MAFPILYPDENNPQVHRHSSIDQFEGFLSVMVKGGWAPIIFDQLDGIDCETIKHHPVAINFGDGNFIYPEATCTYSSDHFVYTDRVGTKKKLLPECFGGGGEIYDKFVKSNSFINFDNDNSLGVHNKTALRVGLDYVKCDKALPAVE